MPSRSCQGRSVFQTFAEKKRTSIKRFLTAHLESGKVELLPLAESRVHAACLEFEASRFTAGLSMGAMIELKPVSNGLFFRLQPMIRKGMG
jgi:hypothetical protein